MIRRTTRLLFGTDPLGDTVGILAGRLAFGGLFMMHGLGKLSDLVQGKTAFFDHFDPLSIGGNAMLGLAVFSEFICGILIVLGLFFRMALIPPILTMMIAFFVFHSGDDLLEKELPLLYLTGFVVMFFTGAGRYSVDSKISK